MKYVPRVYQKRAARAIVDHAGLALWLDMGMGKTVSTLTAISLLLRSFDVRAALIVAPLRVVQTVWEQEARKWDHTRHLRFRTIPSAPAPRTIRRRRDDGAIVETETRVKSEALEALSDPLADVFLVHYDIFNSLCDWMTEADVLPFDMIVFDESSRMKNPSSKRFKLFKPLIGRFSRRLALSGSPAPAGYEDLWSQYYCLDEGARLGKYVTHYRDRFFNEYGYVRKLKVGAKEYIDDRVSDITLCLQAVDHLDMPKLVINDVVVPLAPKLREKYEELEREMFVQIERADVEAMNRAALTMKCRQFTSGAIYEQDEDGKPRKDGRWVEIHQAKLDALEEVIDEAQGSPVLVAYEFKHELARIRKRWPKWTVLEGSGARVSALVDKWNRGEIPVMVAHPASIGHGLNLQYGGHILVWTSGTWGLEYYSQTVARLYRQGQTRPVIVHRLIVGRTIDIALYASLNEKDQTQAGFLNVMKEYGLKKGMKKVLDFLQ